MGNFFDRGNRPVFMDGYPPVSEKEFKYYVTDLVSIVTDVEKKFREGKISKNKIRFFRNILVELESFIQAAREEMLYAEGKTEREQEQA